MASVTFDPSKLKDVIADLEALAKDAPLLVKTVSDLFALFKNKPMSSPHTMIACGPTDGCTDACECCDCTIHCLVQALASAVQCRCCCESTGN